MTTIMQIKLRSVDYRIKKYIYLRNLSLELNNELENPNTDFGSLAMISYHIKLKLIINIIKGTDLRTYGDGEKSELKSSCLLYQFIHNYCQTRR
jgi:hypothetical protein